MPSTTPNFGFEYPLDTDPLADGAQTIEDFATTADTAFADLLGGTTDQVLAKNSDTDMDFKWVTPATPAASLPGSWVFRNLGTTAGASNELFANAEDTFTTEAETRYHFKGQVKFEKAGASGWVELDFNFDSTVGLSIDWSYVSRTVSNVSRQGFAATDISQVTASTSSTVMYVLDFEGIFGTEGVRTLNPTLIATGGTVDIEPDITWMCITKLGNEGDETYGEPGWS